MGLLVVFLLGVSQPNRGRKGILVISFGTSYADTREKTIKATENLFIEAFPSDDVFRVFTSQTIINILNDRDNLQVYNIHEAMKMLKKQGYATVIIQSLHVMNGKGYEEMKRTIMSYENDFNEIVIGKALLTSQEDYLDVAKALSTQLEVVNSDAVVFMGHGTHHEANAVYPALESVLHDLGYMDAYVGTIEGIPIFESILKQLKEKNVNKVTLMPLTLVAGKHALKDMAGDQEHSWETKLKAEGIEVDSYMHGLGENPAIRQLFVQHAETAIKGKHVD